jgi:hypothetical protein
MNQPSISDSNFQQPTPDPWVQQNIEDVECAQEGVNQQAAIGDENSQQIISGEQNSQNINRNENTVNPSFEVNNYFSIGSNDTQGKFSDSESFVDPTKTLPPKSNTLPIFESDALQDNYQKLQEDCLIFVSCLDPSIGFAAAHALADRVGLSNKRLFNADIRSLNNFDALSIDIILRPEIGDGKPTLIVVDIGERQTFLDSLLCRLPRAEDIKNDLRNSYKLCICLVEPETLYKTLRSKKSKPVDLFFPYWEISLQPNRFESKLPEKFEYVDAISLFENANALRKTVLYVATFFTKLNLSDFEQVVLLLIGDKTYQPERREFVFNEKKDEFKPVVSFITREPNISVSRSSNSTEIGEVREIDVRQHELISEIWEDNLDEVLKSCHLKYIKTEGYSRIIDFSVPYVRKIFIDYFENENYAYCIKQFKKIIESGLFFNTSPQVTRNVVKLSVNMMLSSSEEYGSDWLNKRVSDVITQLDEAKTAKASEYIFICISDLFREILNYPELEGLVGSCFEHLISLKRHSAVLAIAKRLRFAPQFDELDWMKQLIERGSEEVRSQVYKSLYNQVKQSSSRVYEMLEQIQTWLPDLGREPKNYSLFNKYALQFLPKYTLETLEKFDPKFQGEQAFRYPLFASLRNDESAERKLEIVATWLLHPGLVSIAEKGVNSLDLVIIRIIPELFIILYGLNKTTRKENFELIGKGLLIAISKAANYYQEETPIKYRRMILLKWNELSKYFLEQCKESRSKKEWEQKNFFNAKRNLVRYLIEQFSSLSSHS